MVSYSSPPTAAVTAEIAVYSPEIRQVPSVQSSQSLYLSLIFVGAIVLVSVPVFIQAPLVRFLPWVSVAVTPFLWWLSARLLARPQLNWLGDLLVGFTWTWLAGSLYWGWLRWEPFLHLPVEAIGLPFAIWGIRQQRHCIGHFFYLGSLLGTAVTDLYFYLMSLIPYWRSLMRVDADLVHSIFQNAIAQIETAPGMGWALALALFLLVIGVSPLVTRHDYWWAFSGAVLSTILVDGLFWLAAATA